MNMVNMEMLLIDDNSAETQVITEIFEENRNVTVTSFKNSGEALKYLHKEGEYENSKTPSLILLDLNTHKKNQEILEEIKTDDVLKCIPLIILTNFMQDKDILECYDHHVNAYVIKRANFDEFIEDIHIFKDFWWNSAMLPNCK